MRALPFLLQLAAHELERNQSTASGASGGGAVITTYHAGEAKKALEELLRGGDGGGDDAAAAAAAGPALPAALVLSLLVTPRSEWVRVRCVALRAAVIHCAREGTGQGRTLVPNSAQLERFSWDRGCTQGLCGPC